MLAPIKNVLISLLSPVNYINLKLKIVNECLNAPLWHSI